MFEYFLLQMNIHHPGGALKTDNSSYAVCWVSWQKCLRSLFSILCNEMNKNLCVRFKSSSLFVNLDSHKMLVDIFATLTSEVCRQVNYFFLQHFLYYVINDLQMFNNKEDNVETSFLDVSSLDCSVPCKKRKLNLGIQFVIDTVRETKDWPW